MTEAELIQTYAELSSGLTANLALYISVLFAYFLVAHSVGKHLSSLQLVLINTVYILVMLLGLQSIYVSMLIFTRVVGELVAIDSVFVEGLAASETFSLVMTGANFIAFVISLIYMYSTRRSTG